MFIKVCKKLEVGDRIRFIFMLPIFLEGILHKALHCEFWGNVKGEQTCDGNQNNKHLEMYYVADIIKAWTIYNVTDFSDNQIHEMAGILKIFFSSFVVHAISFE